MIVYSPEHIRHSREGHPESSYRLEAVLEYLEEKNVKQWVEPERASMEVISRVHVGEHIHNIRKLSRLESRADPDTYLNKSSFDVALLAAGGAVKALEYSRAFSLVRPPGHHATEDRAMGFCLFNNAGVAASCALDRGIAGRVLIFDQDVHHGNGTQDIFYSSGEVLYMSMHQHPLYPGTGHINETGDGEGKGYSVNLPLPPGTGDASYLHLFRQIALPICEQFQPQLIIVSAGYDAHTSDPLGGLNLTEQSYYSIARCLGEQKARVICTLEGGYSLRGLSLGVYASLAGLYGLEFGGRALEKPPQRAVRLVEKARGMLSSWWDF